jgi:hypothetical protein
MQTADYEDFVALLTSPAVKALWPRQQVDDALVAAYWTALKDQPLTVVRKCMERHQQHGKFFPKPADLRPRVDRLPPVDISGGGYSEADYRAIRNLEALKNRDPDAYKREIQLRSLNRLVATQHPGSSMYEAALNELHAMGYDSGRWPNP